MIQIDSDKCTNCGICYEVCPGVAFGVRSTNEHQEIFLRYSDFCVACGHCMAFCKPQAIIHPQLSYDDFEELSEIEITPAAMKNLLFSRRSVRKYRDEPVSTDLIDELIEVATHAGTGTNQQSCGFMVISDKEFLQKLEQEVTEIWLGKVRPFGVKALMPLIRMIYGPEIADVGKHYYDYIKRRKEDDELEGMVFFNAPMLILANDFGKNTVAPINCAIAMRNIETLALTMGLGTCWNGFLIYAANQKPRKINKLLDLDKSKRIWGALTIGYPRYRSKLKIPRREREVTRL